jgi:hypothetical protein
VLGVSCFCSDNEMLSFYFLLKLPSACSALSLITGDFIHDALNLLNFSTEKVFFCIVKSD